MKMRGFFSGIGSVVMLAVTACEGFSQVLGIDTDLVIPDRRLGVYEGAVAPWKGEKLDLWRQQFIKGAKKINFPIHKPIADLSDKQYKTLWEGEDGVLGINDFFKWEKFRKV